MSHSLYTIDLNNNDVYECGADLIALMAYPQEIDDKKRAKARSSLCAYQHFAWHLQNPTDETPVTAKPAYLFQEPNAIDKIVERVCSLFHDRMVAGRMAIALMQASAGVAQERWPRSIKRPSINEVAAFVLDEAGQSDVANLKTRIWRPSAPVIHLAAAAQVIGQMFKANDSSISMVTFLSSSNLITAIVLQAQLYEAEMARVPKLSSAANKLIRVRLAA